MNFERKGCSVVVEFFLHFDNVAYASDNIVNPVKNAEEFNEMLELFQNLLNCNISGEQ